MKRILIALCALGVSSGALADWISDAARCEKPGNVDEMEAACTRAITSGKLPTAGLSAGYYNRGRNWQAKGDNDRAIADYGEAIRLNPKLALAYNNRGLA